MTCNAKPHLSFFSSQLFLFLAQANTNDGSFHFSDWSGGRGHKIWTIVCVME